MRLSRRGLILGGSALLAGCSSAASTTNLQLAGTGTTGRLAGAAPASWSLVVEAAEEHPANRAEPPRIKPRLESRMRRPSHDLNNCIGLFHKAP